MFKIPVEFKQLVRKAREIKGKYAKQNKKLGYRRWDVRDYYQGFVGDVGDLGKLIMARHKLRSYKESEKKLAHELADCLWSLIVIADELGVDLEKEFLKAKLSTLKKRKL